MRLNDRFIRLLAAVSFSLCACAPAMLIIRRPETVQSIKKIADLPFSDDPNEEKIEDIRDHGWIRGSGNFDKGAIALRGDGRNRIEGRRRLQSASGKGSGAKMFLIGWLAGPSPSADKRLKQVVKRIVKRVSRELDK